MENPLDYHLEKYSGIKSRFTCPKCNKPHEFTRYIHSKTGHRLPSEVGICNRRDKCGYFYSNSDFLKDNPSNYERNFPESIPKKPEVEPSFIEWKYLLKSMKQFPENNLYLFLSKLFGEETALQLLKTYLVGTSKHWKGATIYWQVDYLKKVRSGKIMLYNPETGRREHKKQTWVHSLLNVKDFNLSQCLFGEHLLAIPENSNKTIAIVESEKTAIIASFFLNDLIWLASGGLEMFNPITHSDKFRILIGRKVILYPDLSMPNSYNGDTAFENWSRKASHLKKMGIDVKVSELLEKESTEIERIDGFDIADYLVKEI